jgi:WD40 repeat protein
MKLFLILVLIILATALQAQPVYVGGDSDTLWYYDTGLQVNDVKFSPDDNFLAVAMGGSKLMLMDVETGDITKYFEEQGTDISTAVDFLRKDGKEYVVAGGRRLDSKPILEIFDLETGKRIMSLLDDYDELDKYRTIRDVAVSPDQSKLVACLNAFNDYGMVVWDTKTWDIIYDTQEDIAEVEFIPNTNKMVANKKGSNYVIYNLDSEHINLVDELDILGDVLDDFDISSSGKYLYVASVNDFENIEYNLNEKKEINRFQIFGKGCEKIKFSFYEYLQVYGTKGFTKEDFKTVIYNSDIDKVIYSYDYAPHEALAITNNQKYIACVSRIIFLYNARWEGTDVKDHNFTDNLVYPNPAGDVLTLDVPSESYESANIEIVNTVGIKQYEFRHQLEVGDNSVQVNISNLATGFYVIRLTTKTFSRSFKFIKE